MSAKHIQLEIFEHGHKTKRNKGVIISSAAALERNKFPTQICVIASCVIIVSIAIFALGIERGKQIAKNEETSPRIKTQNDRFAAQKRPSKTVQAKKPSSIKRPSKTIQTKKPSSANKKLVKKGKSAKLPASQFVIQVATYKKNSSYIQKEVAKLEKKGYRALVKTSGDYMIIFAGNFRNKKKANEQLRILKKTYKDCFIKRI